MKIQFETKYSVGDEVFVIKWDQKFEGRCPTCKVLHEEIIQYTIEKVKIGCIDIRVWDGLNSHQYVVHSNFPLYLGEDQVFSSEVEAKQYMLNNKDKYPTQYRKVKYWHEEVTHVESP